MLVVIYLVKLPIYVTGSTTLKCKIHKRYVVLQFCNTGETFDTFIIYRIEMCH